MKTPIPYPLTPAPSVSPGLADLSCLYDPTKWLELAQLREKIDNPDLFTQAEIDDLALLCLSDLETFFIIMFLAVDGYAPKIRPFHRAIFNTLHRVDILEIIRLIVNIPPGFGKTHIMKMWVAQWYLKDPRCKFLHLSYSKQLVDDNSEEIRTILQTPIARAIRDVVIRSDASGKQLWKTAPGGVFRAAPTGGQVTGFRAGRLGYVSPDDPAVENLVPFVAPEDEPDLDKGELFGRLGLESFAGAVCIDDPVKPEDANSRLLIDKINNRYPQTVASRLATERVPVVLWMQRIDGKDLSGYLLGGGSGERWHHLVIPDEITADDLDPTAWKEYGDAWLYGDPIQHRLPLGPIWPEKLGRDGIKAKQTHDHTYFAQYRQRPKPRGGRMFETAWFPRYEKFDGWNSWIWVDGVRVKVDFYYVFVDTAQKTGQQHDYSVFELFGHLEDERIALIDLMRGKYAAPELAASARTFLKKYRYQPHVWSTEWRECIVEDKVSGTGLIQTISAEFGGRVVGKPRNRDKYVRACDAQGPIREGRVLLPQSALWLDDYLLEFKAFSRDLNHDHDDQCDPTFDAIEEMIGVNSEADYSGI